MIRRVPDSEWAAIVAAGAWHAGCPAGQADLRRVEVNFHGFDGAVHRGALIVRSDAAPSVVRIFTRLFAAGFPIHRMAPVEVYGGDDNASMAADNTSAYNCRRASQANASPTDSPHANGRAIDVNPFENPWVDPRCHCFRPSAKFSGSDGRPRTGRGVITKGSAAWKIFTSEGWIWQDSATTDFQHFDTGYPSRPLPGSGSAAAPSTATKASAPTTSAAKPGAAALPFPVPVSVGDARQVVTVKGSGSRATVTAWAMGPAGWKPVLTTTSARVGANGLVTGSQRHQGTNTTPAGTYTLTQAFGIRANPGSGLPYHQVTSDDWWVEDNNSRYYNSMRRGSQGGFDTSLPESNVNGSEHLIEHVGQYDYAVVIDFNRHPAVRYRGAGIFLHVSDGQATAGCVAVAESTMVALLRWLNPAAHPRIAIG